MDCPWRSAGNAASRLPPDGYVGRNAWQRIEKALAKEGRRFDGHDLCQVISPEINVAEADSPSSSTAPDAMQTIFDEVFGISNSSTSAPSRPSELMTARCTRVFLVHGHDHGLKNTVARFLEILGLAAIILHEQADKEETLIAKLRANGDVSFAVVLCTADDSVSTAKGQVKRARQNVVLELGYFAGKLGLDGVCAIVDQDLEMPSDLGGVIYAPRAEWQYKLLDRLTAAGFKFQQEAITAAMRVR